MKEVTEMYLIGIREGRELFEREGVAYAAEHIANLRSTIKGFPASNSVGQMLRGELDFWLNKTKRLYHVVAINDRTGRREQQTTYPMTHAECCTFKAKQSDGSKRHGVRFMLVEDKA